MRDRRENRRGKPQKIFEGEIRWTDNQQLHVSTCLWDSPGSHQIAVDKRRNQGHLAMQTPTYIN